MTEHHAIKRAACVFQAARVGHDEEQKLKATEALAKAVVQFLDAGGGETSGEERLRELALLLQGQGKQPSAPVKCQGQKRDLGPMPAPYACPLD